MGCGNSKNQIHVASTSQAVDNTKGDPLLKDKPPLNRSASRPISNTTQSRNKSAGGKSRRSAWGGSTDSLAGDDRSLTNDPRGGSATSKASKHSCDSGFDDDGYNKVITESSDPDQIRQIEKQFQTPRELDLDVVGQACPHRLSAKDKERLEEQRILATLQQEGLITRPMSKAAFGVSFEVIQTSEAGDFLPRRPPARLAKLEKRKKKRKLTEEELKAKMERAEQRRKEQERRRLAKIQAVTMKSDVTNAMDELAARQEDVINEKKAKEEQAVENRERRLQELKEKLRRKEEHAEMVRRRRVLAPIQPNDEEMEMIQSRNFSEDTPIVTSQDP